MKKSYATNSKRSHSKCKSHSTNQPNNKKKKKRQQPHNKCVYTFFWSIFNLIKVYISRHNQIVFFDDPKPFHFSIFIKYIQENPKKKQKPTRRQKNSNREDTLLVVFKRRTQITTSMKQNKMIQTNKIT